jgi:uncharacterized protein YdeI (BOF family)
MFKRVLLLMVTSTLISVGLLYVGFMIFSQYTPARASTLKALVADSAAPIVADNLFSGVESGSEDDSRDSDSVSSPEAASSAFSRLSQASSITTTTGVTPVATISIADLLKNPEQHDDTVFSITGLVTSLNDEKFLLNDGTGQILVEVEDEIISLATINGLSVTVTGKFDDSSSSSGAELEACSLTYNGQTIIVDDCLDDDGDDMDDDDDLDDDDDMDDDIDDDDDDDDDMDGDSDRSGESGGDDD